MHTKQIESANLVLPSNRAAADARLIADLLAALRNLCDAIAHTPAKSHEAITAYDAARAAIQKATS